MSGAESQQTIYIVSGLPRSGTSMMMRVLAYGGVPVFEDGERAADDDNPVGYFEHQKAKKLREETSWLADGVGKVVKVVSPLIQYLPSRYDYKVIMMKRHLNEVLQSQKKMMQRVSGELASEHFADEELKLMYQRHLAETEDWCQKQTNIDYMTCGYAEILSQPMVVISEIARFLNRPLDSQKAAQAIDIALHRNICQE